ncbi:cerebellin-1-like [Saccostrea cucullata]|uniref:cerebellin-1-like n=1 Tax=Saccostrea cuccullata TaxID=36930 RepID=UPI002ED6001D
MRNRTNHELPLTLGLISSSADDNDGKEDLKSTSPIKRADSGSVAFSAYMSDHEPEPSPHHTFIFDSVLTNVGHGNNKHSGIFTAPHTGIYVFAWTVYCDPHGYIFSQIAINSNLVGASFTDAYDSTYTQTSNGLIVVEINEGDTVFIRTHPTNSNKGRITSNPVEHRTSFSGWKIN